MFSLIQQKRLKWPRKQWNNKILAINKILGIQKTFQKTFQKLWLLSLFKILNFANSSLKMKAMLRDIFSFWILKNEKC